MQWILWIKSQLPENLHSELWSSGAYLLNYLLLASTSKSPLQMINEWRDKTGENAKSQCAHIRTLDRHVYLMNKKISKNCKSLFCAHIDYLTNFDAINIYYIWISYLKQVFHIKNIWIDKIIIFDSDNFHFNSLIITEIKDFICIVEISNLSDIV